MKTQMNRIFLTLLFALATGASLSAQAIITGKVVGAGGGAPETALLFLDTMDGGYDKPVATAAKDGSFSLPTTAPGLYRLWVATPTHMVTGIPVVITETDKAMSVTLTLVSHAYKTELENVQIVIGAGRTAKRSPMTKEADGTFSYTAAATADTIGYQLEGIAEDGHTVSGTMQDRFVYDGGGDFYSVVNVKKGETVKIIFNPKQLTRSSKDATPKAVWDKDHTLLSEMADIDRQVIFQTNAVYDAMSRLRRTGGDLAQLKPDYNGVDTSVQRMMRDASKPLALRQFAAVKYASLPLIDLKQTASEILTIAPVESAMWGARTQSIGAVISKLTAEKQNATLRAFVDKNPDRRVRAIALMMLVGEASRNKSAELPALYKKLKTEYGELREIQYALTQYNPDRAVIEGKAVPKFSVKLLETGKTVSDKSMLGKVYMIDFWAVWCGPCVGEMPSLHTAYEKYKGKKGFTVLSLSFDRSPDDITKFRAATFKMPWLHAFVDNGFDNALSKAFEVSGIPKPVLVNEKGIVIATEEALRGNNLEKTLEKFLNAN